MWCHADGEDDGGVLGPIQCGPPSVTFWVEKVQEQKEDLL